ncbi:MAG: hypothetical protein ABI623_04685 [bacterium]
MHYPLSILVIVMVMLNPSPTAASQPAEQSIENGSIKLVLKREGNGYSESYYAFGKDRWRLVLQNGSAIRPDPALKASGTGNAVTTFEKNENENSVQVITKSGSHTISKIFHMKTGEPFLHVSMTDSIAGQSKVEYLLSTYSFLPDGKRYNEYKPLDFVFTPQLRPQPDEVIGDHTFRSPAFMIQKGNIFAALIPDLPSIDGETRVLRASADLQVETSSSPFVSFGLMNWVRKKEHVYYAHNESLAVNVADTSLSFGYYLYLSATATPRQGFQDVVRFEWEKYGHQNFMSPVGPQSEPFSTYIHRAWYEFLPTIAHSASYTGKSVTLLTQGRLAWSNSLPKEADNDSWFNVWFNALRTAYGMYLYGQQVGDAGLKKQAVGVLELALSAPQAEGLSPSIFYFDSSGGHWVPDQKWGGIAEGEYFSVVHNAWTNYWLLQWTDLLPARKKEIELYTERFAAFLLSHQKASGVFSSWFHSTTLQPAETFANENAETAGSAFFLAELYKRTGDTKYLSASEKAMQYIFTSILPENKWFDYETFFSCSRKPVGFFDTYTQQHPQNTLSMFMAAEACYALYGATNKAVYKDHGTAIMDYLSLYQQVWSPKWLSCELLGGFGVQNTDGEWSDSRQGYFCITLMHYYELTGKREYFERGVAALRSMFSLFEPNGSPRTAENYGHGAYNSLSGTTGIHWGTGSSVVSIHIIRKKYGDAFINVRQGWGVGIDGCRFDSVEVRNDAIRFALHDVVHSPRNIVLMCGELQSDSYTIEMNKVVLGRYSRKQLEDGIEVRL